MLVLVLGGSRSGKSALAERMVDGLGVPVTYVATGQVTDGDMAARVEAHRVRRPPSWTTVEVAGRADAGGGLAAVVRSLEGAVLVDSLGTWVAGHQDFVVDGAGLASALAARAGTTVVVSDEVGMGVHPATDVGRRFRDALGRVNETVAEVADQVLLVVAGRVLPLARAEDVLG